MSNDQVIVYRDRTNIISVNVGFPITTDIFTSQIRAEPTSTATLLATWDIDITDALTGELTLTLDNTNVATIVANTGYMDLKRTIGGEPLPVFDAPLEVIFRGSVTA